MLETLLLWLTVAFVGLAVTGVAAFFIVRWAFLRIATRMSDAIDRRVGAAAGAALTHLAQYAKAAGLDLSEANRRFGKRIDALAKFMDSAITLPLIGPVGFDAAIGLIPVVG